MSPLKRLQEADAAAARALEALTEAEATPDLPKKAEAVTRACNELFVAVTKVKAAARLYRNQPWTPPVTNTTVN